MIVNMIWHVLQKVVKCYLVPLPRLSCIYWPIYFKTLSTDTPRLLIFRDGIGLWNEWMRWNEWDGLLTMKLLEPNYWKYIQFYNFTAFLSKDTTFTTFTAEWLSWTGQSCNQSPSDIHYDTFDKNSWQCWFKDLKNLAKRIILIVCLVTGRVLADGYITVLKIQTEIRKERRVKIESF